MNQAWSELNKTMQVQIKTRDTYEAGVATLFDLRNRLMDTLTSFRAELRRADFDTMPFPHAEGYHSKTIAYSIWHVARIEDIVAHTLIGGDEQIFFSGDYQARIHAPIITTGNELVEGQIVDFSRKLDLEELYAYAAKVMESTERLIAGLPFDALKRRIPEERKACLQSLHVVSDEERARWLIDYWCGKDIRGLVQMPFSRHWIMHTEACLRIRKKIRP